MTEDDKENDQDKDEHEGDHHQDQDADSLETAFPINSVSSVCDLFRAHLARPEPDLALLSLVVGFIENTLTDSPTSSSSSDKKSPLDLKKHRPGGFPEITLKELKQLLNKFSAAIEAFASPAPENGEGFATREIVKRVSDAVWNSLTRSYYKDRAHLQSVYSYLNGKKLDCFGVAFAVVAGCQALGYRDVHLALSEDHAWVVFGKDGKETAEVTWHGKGNEDKRGQPIGLGGLSRSWLYVAGYPVVCTRHMEVAALVSSINPTLNATTDVHEIALMQQSLLWILYDEGYLSLYPMALGNLGELEEYSKFEDGKRRPTPAELYEEAIRSAKKNYANKHVYPYTFQAAYFYRNKMYKEAFGSWADAGDVIRTYNYSRDDEEIYKEFLEIANEIIPQIMKTESSGHSARSILKDPQCFAHLLRFYDGICKWEEESQTPILHIGWAKPLVNTISKFDADVRAQVNILCLEEEPDNVDEPKENPEGDGDLPSNNEETKKEDENKPKDEKTEREHESSDNPSTVRELSDEMEAVINSHPTSTLYSHKMKGLKNLLLSEKLNTHAISLQLTAQSQVFVNKKARPASETGDQQTSTQQNARPKRVRRE